MLCNSDGESGIGTVSIQIFLAVVDFLQAFKGSLKQCALQSYFSEVTRVGQTEGQKYFLQKQITDFLDSGSIVMDI